MSEIAQRLAWPITVNPDTGSLATVDQDSDADIAQCITAILRTRPGDRPDIPDLGIPDLAHSEEPIDLSPVSDALARHEPRATALLRETPLDQLLDEVDVDWTRTPTEPQER